MCSGISKRQCVPEAREEAMSFDLPTDDDQHHQLELLRKDTEVQEVAFSYLRTSKFIGKATIILKLCCPTLLP